MNIKINKRDIERLWGDGGPYSQVQVVKEFRVLDDGISRVKYNVYANINPATYEILKKGKSIIKDKDILKILNESEYKNEEEGYIWSVCHGLDKPEEADYVAEQAVHAVIEAHKLVINILEATIGLKRNREI